jgi:predicted RNA-binding Zn-ribbon protein involved in translation (DUF1610 family)
MAITCVVCGTVADSDADVPLGWSMSTSDRGKVFTCPQCVRENVRSIEAKLDEAWW